MKRVSIEKTPVKIKEKLLLELCSAVSGAKCISRSRISELSGLSLMTVSKFASALLSASILTEKDGIPDEGGRKRGLLYWNNIYSVAVFDLSSRRYSMSTVTFDMNEEVNETYYYNDDFTEYENLSIFLGKCINRTKNSKGFNAIGVIIPDKSRTVNERLFPPPDFSVEEINRVFSDVMGLIPDIVLPFTDSVIDGIKYNRVTSSSGLDAVYILIGRTLGCLFVGSDGTHRTAKPQNLIFNKKPLSRRMQHIPLDLAPLKVIINAARSMYDPDIIIIESDIENYLYRDDKSEPDEIYLEESPPLYIYGCACRLRSYVLMNTLMTQEKSNTEKRNPK